MFRLWHRIFNRNGMMNDYEEAITAFGDHHLVKGYSPNKEYP